MSALEWLFSAGAVFLIIYAVILLVGFVASCFLAVYVFGFIFRTHKRIEKARSKFDDF